MSFVTAIVSSQRFWFAAKVGKSSTTVCLRKVVKGGQCVPSWELFASSRQLSLESRVSSPTSTQSDSEENRGCLLLSTI